MDYKHWCQIRSCRLTGLANCGIIYILDGTYFELPNYDVILQSDAVAEYCHVVSCPNAPNTF